MASEKFIVDLRAAVAKAKGRADIVARKVMLDLFSRVILRSPVDTGRFRGNWQVSIGTINTTTTAALDPSGSGSLGRVKAAAAAFQPGQIAFLANSLPYARRLEYGWSKQAPAGMVRVTAREFNAAVAKAAGSTSGN